MREQALGVSKKLFLVMAFRAGPCA